MYPSSSEKNKKIKVALMSYSMDNRQAKGSALYTQKLIEQLLSDTKFEFFFVHYEKTNDVLYKRAQEIIMPKVKLPYGSRFISQLLFYWKYRNNKFDIIHWFQPRVYPFFWLAPAYNKIVTAHGAGDITAPSFFNFSKLVFNFTLKYFNRLLDIVIADSEAARQEVITYYRVQPKKVKITYCGGGEDYTPISKELAFQKVSKKYNIFHPYILTVGRLQPHKNIPMLIKAYNQMRTQHPERTEHLVIVGKPHYGHDEIYALAAESPYSLDIQFISYIEINDLNALYSAAEVFVFPSLNEGFGLPVLEAMASGAPVITTTVTSLPEIAGDAGILVDPHDATACASHMNSILSNKSIRETLIQKGLERAKHFTWAKTGEATKKIYLDLLQK